MRFYKVDMKGKFFMPKGYGVPSAHGQAEEARLHYNQIDESLSYADSTTWVSIYTANNLTQLANDLATNNVPLNADNLLSGTVPSARLTGSYDINITGTATYA